MQTSLLKFNSQDTMVLGKNARHSFGRAQDPIPAPTRSNLSNELETEKQAHARERP